MATDPTTLLCSTHVALPGGMQPARLELDASGKVTAIHAVGAGDITTGAEAHGTNSPVVGRDPAPGSASDACIDVGSVPVLPAPLDLHFHGCGGVSVAPDGDPAALAYEHARLTAEVEEWTTVDSTIPSHLVHSVPEYLATLPVPGARGDALVQHIASAAQAISATENSGCVGLRLEGCFINPVRGGVWPVDSLQPPDIGLLHALIDAARDGGVPLRVVDVAPELPGALELVAAARERGIVVAMAHTDATYDEARRGCDAGITLATHLFNAMSALHHRSPGAVGAALDHPGITVELICDGLHVHPAVARIVARAVGWERVALVSDASPFAGLPAGTYTWNSMRIISDGRSLRNTAGALAGSHAVLADAARPGCLGSQLSPWSSPLMSSVVPRRVLDSARSNGIAVGDRIWLPGVTLGA